MKVQRFFHDHICASMKADKNRLFTCRNFDIYYDNAKCLACLPQAGAMHIAVISRFIINPYNPRLFILLVI
jgi:hypothetical protein